MKITPIRFSSPNKTQFQGKTSPDKNPNRLSKELQKELLKADPKAVQEFLKANTPGLNTAELKKEFLKAIAANDTQTIQKLITEKNVSVDEIISVEGVKGTPLLLSIQVGAKDVFNLFLAQGADVNKALPEELGYQQTPLMKAVQKDNLYFVTELLKAGAEVNTKSKEGNYGFTALQSAKSVEVLEALITAGADLKQFGPTKLKGAINLLQADIVEFLLTHGVSGDIADFRRTLPHIVKKQIEEEALAPIFNKKMPKAGELTSEETQLEKVRQLLQKYDKIVSLLKQYE